MVRIFKVEERIGIIPWAIDQTDETSLVIGMEGGHQDILTIRRLITECIGDGYAVGPWRKELDEVGGGTVASLVGIGRRSSRNFGYEVAQRFTARRIIRLHDGN